MDIKAEYAALVASISAAILVWKKSEEIWKFVKGLWDKLALVVGGPQKILDKLSAQDVSMKKIDDAVQSIQTLVQLSQLRTRLVWASWPIGVFECDVSGKCIWVNEALMKIFGLRFDEMLDYGWLKGIDDLERSRVQSEWLLSVQNGFPFSWEYTVVNKETGERIRCRAATLSLKIGNTLCGYHGTVAKVRVAPKQQ